MQEAAWASASHTYLLVTLDLSSRPAVFSHAGSTVRDVRSPTLAGVPLRSGDDSDDPRLLGGLRSGTGAGVRWRAFVRLRPFAPRARSRANPSVRTLGMLRRKRTYRARCLQATCSP